MIAVVIGRRETGKSTLGYFLAKDQTRRVIFDPREHFRTTENREPDADTLYDLMSEQPEIIVQPPFHVPQHFSRTCDELVAWVRDNRIGDVDPDFSFLIDEAYDAKTFEDMPVGLDWLLRKTAGARARIVFTCHQPKHLATDIRALTNHFFLFQMTQKHDLAAIYDQCGEEVVEKLPNLGPRQFIHWDNDKQVFELHDRPAVWYVDIKKQREKEENGNQDRAAIVRGQFQHTS